jgi:hypothetical protein
LLAAILAADRTEALERVRLPAFRFFMREEGWTGHDLDVVQLREHSFSAGGGETGNGQRQNA